LSFRVVLAKECIDNMRDRRTLLSSFSLAALGPIFLVGVMVFVLERALGESDEPVSFAVIGASHAPQLMRYLEDQDTDIVNIASADPKALVASGDYDLVLVIHDDYADRYMQGITNSLTLAHDSSELSSTRQQLMKLNAMLYRYSRTIGMLRLQLRGVDPSISLPIVTQELDIASPAARALTVLASLPYFLVLVIFMGGFYLAIDTTAGEREHGSLEPLLSQPAGRSQLVLGKIVATSVFGAVGLVLFLISLYIAVPFVPFERLGMALEIGVWQLLGVFFVSLPLIFFAAALLTVVASFAKSYKEAQTYLTLVILVPTLPLIFAQLTNVDATLSTMFVPSLGQAGLMADLIKGDSVPALNVAVSMIMTGLWGAALALIATRLYQREGILG